MAPKVEAPYEIPGLPISDGPISHQRKLTPAKGEQPIIVVLPAGAFQYVWEMLESKARIDHQKYASIPSITIAAEDSVRSFRIANSAALARLKRREVRRKR
ncbi:hypothetical protein UFOVP1246_49 [uncultured Caudovirales phage]|uniref:Uncharacterized protein n=1 Tax=uncultured Caudovirales phage TaxID=2100421 RepID=A0A6J5RN06_9CAUD|nr:hypothetical protein UFOVP1246_49 [uncultured Caudovirales phage]